jgi:hypothetical protein
VTTHRDNDKEADSDKIAFVTYKDDEESRGPPPDREHIELFRRPYDPAAPDKPREREKRIKFEVVDDSAVGAKKLGGFNPYDSTAKPKSGSRR